MILFRSACDLLTSQSENQWVPYNANKKDRLCIMDPSREGNDISGGTSAVGTIFKAFSEAHALLVDPVNANDPATSILSYIIGGQYKSYDEQRQQLKKIWDVEYKGRGSSSSSGNARASGSSRSAGPPGQQIMMGQVDGPPAMLGSYAVEPSLDY
jgi:hypothetical protein